jgi:hypothetical protein
MDSFSTNEDNSVSGRLARLEGMFLAFQGSINAQNQQTAQFLVRVERLEERQLSLERNVATTDDFRNLACKVDRLVVDDAAQKGRQAASQFAIPALAQWLAVVVSFLALVGVGINRQSIDQNQLPPVIKAP